MQGQNLAFPGAEGFGKYATGGRGGEVLVVTNLNDSGPGSLREAVERQSPRIIVFSVSGTIQLKSELDIKYGNVSILGHSAPGQGITLRDYPIIASEVDNLIIRYIRSRLGDETKFQGDAISINRCNNVIVDHCSFSWSSDESATFYDNTNATIQYCIISESLNASVHAKGEHGYGGIWGGKKATFHHNLFAHHKSRTPRFHGARYHKMPKEEIVDFRNNVIYNWQQNNSYGGEEGNHNIINNYYKAGPATESKADKILDPYKPYGKFYLSGNILEGHDEVNMDNWEGVNKFDEIPQVKLNQPIQVEDVPTETALAAFNSVLLKSGASYSRDAIDQRVVEEVREGLFTYGEKGIIDSQKEVGGWPSLMKIKTPRDEDNDEIADAWERKSGLNPRDSSDSAERSLSSGYSNIEMYLNSLLEKR